MRHRARTVNPTAAVLFPEGMEYVEEREFLLRLEVRCPFPPDYDGDQDGYAWVESFRPIAAQIVQAAAAAVKAHPGWRVRFANRGRSTDEEVTLVLERIVEPEPNVEPRFQK
jgi:hypothetical protein